MKKSKVKYSNYTSTTWDLCEFDSLLEFYNYITENPTNKAFENKHKSSQEVGCKDYSHKNLYWHGTKTYEEAISLFKNGWSEGAQELTLKLKKIETQKEVQTQYKNILSMCGYQAIVPLYLQDVPNNMINKKLVPVKNKVITINRAICCSSSVSPDTLKNESVKCFLIIKKIEQAGIRVNLNLLISTGHVCVKIRLKSANEKLNISKLAFPLIHPAMFRRLYFRFIETYPTIPKSYVYGYGSVIDESTFKNVCGKNEFLLPTLLKGTSNDNIVKLSVDELMSKLS